jgi:hypothetical protein
VNKSICGGYEEVNKKSVPRPREGLSSAFVVVKGFQLASVVVEDFQLASVVVEGF